MRAPAVAVEVLDRAEREGRFAEPILRELGGGLDPRDQRQVTTLVYGVIRYRRLLDHLVSAVTDRAPDQVEPALRNILRQGAYALLFLDRVPAYAAVHRSVSLARRIHRASGGFVNAALRGLARRIAGKGAEVPPDARCTLPRPDGTFVRLSEPLLPDPAQAVEHLGVAHSHPGWMVERWLARYGRERTEAILRADNAPPGVTLRVQARRTTRDELIRRLAEEGVAGRPGAVPECVHLERAGAPARLKVFREGLCTVQDEAAMRPAAALSPRAGELALDLCSGVGGKATHLAEIAGEGARVVAADVDAERLAKGRENRVRLGLGAVAEVRADARALPFGAVFPVVLVDAPCTNTGVLARRPEARWRLGPDDPARMARLQRVLLDAGAAAAAPAARLAYSTCSIEPEENEEVVTAFSQAHPDWRMARSGLELPAPGRGGGFWALWVRGGAA